MLWDLAEGKRLYSLDAGDVIHALCFSPNRYWLCAATQACIKVWHPSFMCHSIMLVNQCLLVTRSACRVQSILALTSACRGAYLPFVITLPCATCLES